MATISRHAFAAALLLAAVMLPAAGARAEGDWCAYAGGRDDYENCGYYTLQQCLAAVSGVGGACRPNPRGSYRRFPHRYDDVPPPPPPRRAPPRY